MQKNDWFTDWFNTPYYHILYKDRNDADAQLFIKNITQFLQLSKDKHILDLPCGKGRHSIFLNQLGYKVTGGDLSENSIKHAKQFENEKLKFKVHDMRKPFRNKYDAVFNLFTSFGYFVDDKEDLLVLKNIKEGLKNNGIFVFDFLNAIKVKNTLIKKETKIIEDITFHISREIKEGFILKHIHFLADNKNHSFTERVKYLDVDTMKNYFLQVGFTINAIFGDYQLNDFQPESSDRLIIVAQ